jgi:hypothetical protein
MSEEEAAKKFNLELDGLFAGGKRPASGADPLMDAAEKLIRADFSGESEIRVLLRERLIAEKSGAGGFLEIIRSLRRNTWTQAALASACLLSLLLPVMRTERRNDIVALTPVTKTSPAVVKAGLPGKPGNKTAPAGNPAAAARAIAGPAVSDFFRSVPMGSLSGERLHNFPIETSAEQFPIVVAEGRRSDSPAGTEVRWETEHVVITLENRVISPEDLFERRSL